MKKTKSKKTTTSGVIKEIITFPIKLGAQLIIFGVKLSFLWIAIAYWITAKKKILPQIKKYFKI